MHHALEELSNLLGPKGFTRDPVAMAPWLTDWRGRYTGRASAMLSPASTDEVAAAVQIVARHGLSLVPQGGNSGMVAGATPGQAGDELLLSLRRMDAIAFDPGDETVRCGAGVILEHLHTACAARERRFPLTLGGKGSATVGGLIATNAGGTQVLRHGTMRASVAGLVAVTADGAKLDLSHALPKDNRGFDLKQLFIGSEGTLGIVSEAVLHTVPALIDRAVAWVGLSSPQAAYALLRHIQARGRDALEGFEILPAASLDAVLRHIPGTRAPLPEAHPWNALIEWVRDDGHALDPAHALAAMLAEAPAIADGVIAKNESEADALWKLRDAIAEAERAEGPAVQHDISVPVPAMADFITAEGAAVEARFAGTEAIAFGHLGDGNVHFHVKAPPGANSATWPAGAGADVSRFVYDRVAAYGGSLSAEHGIGRAKRDELARLTDPARLATMLAVKRALDPAGLLNPGKLLRRDDMLAPDTAAT